ncbi:catabolite repression protein creC [Ceratobasidium sp. AG-Ba]|nr:catabolite repression protein creC [Ceratobasidium sp. AG-Ba]
MGHEVPPTSSGPSPSAPSKQTYPSNFGRHSRTTPTAANLGQKDSERLIVPHVPHSPHLLSMATIENDLTFVAPEGVYSLTEEYKPPPIHASTAQTAALFHSKLTTVTVKFPAPKPGGASQGFTALLGGGKGGDKSAKKKGEESGSESDSGGLDEEVNGSQEDLPHAPQQLFSPNGSKGGQPLPGKRKSVSRPKHSIKTTSSSFVTRLHTMEGLSKYLAAKSGDVTFVFYNAGKSFYWMDVSGKHKASLPSLGTYPSCHAVNTLTSSSTCLDVIIGFNTGDLVWFEPMSSRYVRINKQGCVNPSPCTQVRWVPSSRTLLLASYADGTVVVYDTERQDAPFTPLDPANPIPVQVDDGEKGSTNGSGPGEEKAQKMWNPLDELLVTSNASGVKATKNPVSHWRVTDKKSIADFVFSPDVRYVAAISEDGCLRIIDALTETLMDVYQSYFGALTCVAWSPDGRYILVGGQDDLVTVLSPWEQRVIARCQGHLSFVSSVAFDASRIDSRTYRFGSVGEDNRLILWDLSSGALHRPKLHGHNHPSYALASTLSLALRRPTIEAPVGPGGEFERFHPAPSRMEVALIQPVVVKPIEGDLLAHVSFLSTGIMTMTRSGVIKQWVRPLEAKARFGAK